MSTEGSTTVTHRIAGLLVLLALALLAGACGGSASTTAEADAENGSEAASPTFPMTVENCGEEVVLDEAPEDVLTIGTVAVELLHAAGAADRIVARAGEFGSAPLGEVGEAVADVEILTGGDPGQEAILGTEADLVVGYGLFETTPEDLSTADVDHLTVSGYCGDHGGGEASELTPLELVSADIRTYGELFGTAETAGEAADAFDDAVAAVEPVEDGGTVAGVYWFGPDPSAYGNGSMADAMFDRLGLDNVFGDVDQQFIELNVEELIAADPDTIVLFHSLVPDADEEETMRRLLALPGAEDLRAVAQDRIVSIEGVHAEPSPSALEGLEQIADGLAAR